MNIAVVSNRKIILNNVDYKDCEFSFFNAVVSPNVWAEYEAVFLIEPVDINAVKSWTGHPHLRQLDSEREIGEEIESILKHIEIEKKYLVEYPELKLLEKYYPFKAEIEQVYLVSDKGAHRIRKRVSDGVETYIETLKMRISGTKCFEYEKRITEKEYNELLKKADPSKKAIRKNRFCFLFEKQYFELDVYEFWDDKATLEIELKSENQKVVLPPEIKLIKDVSNDSYYKNNNLASVI